MFVVLIFYACDFYQIWLSDQSANNDHPGPHQACAREAGEVWVREMHFHCGHQETAEEAHGHCSQQEIEFCSKAGHISRSSVLGNRFSCFQISDDSMAVFWWLMAGVGRLLVGGGAVLLGYTITNNALNKVMKKIFTIISPYTPDFRGRQVHPPTIGWEAAMQSRRETNIEASSSSQIERWSAGRCRGRRHPWGREQCRAAGEQRPQSGDHHLGRFWIWFLVDFWGSSFFKCWSVRIKWTRVEIAGHGASSRLSWKVASSPSFSSQPPAPLPFHKVGNWLLSSLITHILIRIEEMLQAVPPPWPARLVWSQELEQRFPWLAGQQPGALEVSLYFHSAQLLVEFSNLTSLSKIIFSKKGFDGWLGWYQECF